jgi:Pregnancy-associated plasma protein-A/Secretion system C-terminal sorting domain
MKAGFIIALGLLFVSTITLSQNRCGSFDYMQEAIKNSPWLIEKIRAAENAVAHSTANVTTATRLESSIIKIPVVVHILYHTPEEKITDAQVISQIEALNKYFRRRNNDTASTPAYFRALAADCEIEFKLATTAPGKKFSNGITRNYTPITKWAADDKMKFATEMGTDAWDTKNYLNIWVCNLNKLAGYATTPGSDASKDGIVISYKAFGTTGAVQSGYNQGKTAVHEIGHWLGLKHIWGDANCGEDGIEDTPKQASYTMGCPSTVRITCGNGPYGDMYMNYMDLTNDECVNMFTQGQKAKMRALFADGAFRSSILATNAFLLPEVQLIPAVSEDPKWLEPRLYPNPASNELTLDLSYDSRWIGKNIFVTNITGQDIMNVQITSKIVKLNVTNLKPGLYFLAAKKDDGVSIKTKFIKL